jgi:putative ABC transport system permease protein
MAHAGWRAAGRRCTGQGGMMLLWLKGVLAHRSRRLLLAGAGIAVATALIGIVGIFAASSAETMTRRALESLPIDWQIAVLGTSDPELLTDPLKLAAPVRMARTVRYADVPGFEAVAGGTTQTTGAGQVVGLSPDYAQAFPGQIRLLAGRLDGILIAQQTAANLHATVGDTVSIMRDRGPAAAVKIDGVVDLPNADAMFQAIGPAKAAAPTAPPDNVVLVPMDLWTTMFGSATEAEPAGVRTEIHVSLDHARLLADPETAYADALGRSKNFEARAAGTAIVGNNIAARLGAVRGDALYARVLLLALALPGAVLAVLLTIAIAASGIDRHRREQALLRLRGASASQILRIATTEATVVALASGSGAVALAASVTTAVLRVDPLSSHAIACLVAAFGSAILLALATTLVPAWVASRQRTVSAERAGVAPLATPMWRRAWLDLVLLALAAMVFWRTRSTGYQIVLAPEGVAGAAVDYTALLAPLLFWIGAGLLTVRLCAGALARGRSVLAHALAPLARRLSAPVAASLSRQHHRLARGMALAALAFSFAISTAIFNSTYDAQLAVDAQLTNGADVTVTGTTSAPAGDQLRRIVGVPGVVDAEPMQQRFAYVGNDLQDLYGIEPGRIGKVTEIADAYFANHDARASLEGLSRTPDGVLVSQETMDDFQLSPGDEINLRLQSAVDHQYRVVPFHLVGVVREFPTAPHDSFLVANAKYVAKQTGSSAAEIVLAKVDGDPARVAAAVAVALGSDSPLKVTDLTHAARLVGSSLTAVDLHALTLIELAFAVLLAVGATGLVLALGFAERARAVAILSVLGARRHEVASFLWSEALVLLLGGILFGSLMGAATADIMVTLLAGVFDPPPESLLIPWGYIGALSVASLLGTILAVWGANRRSGGDDASALRVGD